MKRYHHWFELLIIILYPVTAFILLSNREAIASWWVPAIVAVLFCLLWPNLRSVLISHVLMWTIAVPLWLHAEAAKGVGIFIASVSWIILMYIGVVLLPSLLLVSVKIHLWRKYKMKQSSQE